MSNKQKPCRHNRVWIIFGGLGEWCYECGAFRLMARRDTAAICPDSVWAKPVGPGGRISYQEWERRSEAYRAIKGL